jgi:ribosomal protein S18 acetylase RimI-like enzyme
MVPPALQCSADVIIRPGSKDDAPRLAKLGAALFTQAFSRLYSPADLATFLTSVYSEQAVMYDFSAGYQYWLAETREEPIGYIKYGKLGLPIDVGMRRAVELKQLYVEQAYHGRGVAGELMAKFHAWARETKAQDAYVSCWSENARALAFYSRYGFQRVGEYLFAVGSQLDREWILRQTL